MRSTGNSNALDSGCHRVIGNGVAFSRSGIKRFTFAFNCQAQRTINGFAFTNSQAQLTRKFTSKITTLLKQFILLLALNLRFSGGNHPGLAKGREAV